MIIRDFTSIGIQRLFCKCVDFHIGKGIRSVSQYAKDLKKFYGSAHITQSPGRPGYFDINLDQKKLKTPSGNLFQVPGEGLALAVAAEWNSQKELIKRHTMHITSLCNTAIDNPMKKKRSDLMRTICHYLSTDTLCFRMEEPEKLVQFQKVNWDPILNWFNERYKVKVEPTVGIACPNVTDEVYDSLEKQLSSYTDWVLFGLEHNVNCLKSLSLALALMEQVIDVPQAVYLSRLEQVYQVEQWGAVEWYHDIEVLETQAKIAAATVFIHLCHDITSHQTKITRGTLYS